MSVLLIDQGNSRLKWAVHAGNLPLASERVSYRDQSLASALEMQWASLARPERVLVASVADSGSRYGLQQWLQHRWSLTPEFLVSPAQGQGIRNAYSEPARLGCDRWAAMVAAYHLAGSGVCVVDCGTAVTLDVVTAEGQHRGGLILPGLAAMQTGLGHHTALPQVDFATAGDALLGVTTEDAIVLGSTRAVAALVDETLTAASEQYGDELACYLTGGDAGLIVTRLAGPCVQVPDLVLQGLAMIAGDT